MQQHASAGRAAVKVIPVLQRAEKCIASSMVAAAAAHAITGVPAVMAVRGRVRGVGVRAG
eukprot:SAG31_NODE_1585_length_7821_cov_5.615903_3_plen_60_part_00